MVINITGGNKTIRSLTKSPVEYCADKLKLNDTIIRHRIFQKLYTRKTEYLVKLILMTTIIDPKEFTMTVDSTVSKRRIMETQYTKWSREAVCLRRIS